MNPSSSPAPNKQVIYVDVDDEITTIIDKMNASESKIIALVLPKRASVFQSIVNMKLLKRRADAAKKNLVLITSEASLMPLAGMAGLHVAPTTQSKPEIPAGLAGRTDDGDEDEETAMIGDDFDRAENTDTPVSSMAGGANAVLPDDDVVMLDNTTKGNPLVKPAAAGVAAKAAKDKKLVVPNFIRFRKRLILGGLALVLLIAGWYVAYYVVPSADITIKTNSSDIDANLAMTLDTAAGTVDASKLIVPAQTKQEQKSNTQQTAATGQDNKGDKATGSVTLVNCSADSSPITVPAGTGVSVGGQTFITQKTAQLENSTPNCKAVDGFTSSTVNMTAQKAGAAYNVGPSDFTVAGISNVKAYSSAATAGGTDNNVKVVQQSDVDVATQKLNTAQDQDAVKRQLQSRLQDDGLYALTSTFFAGTPNITTSSNVGDEAENVTVTQSMTYTMFGVKKADVDKLIQSNLKTKIDESKQSILDNGLDKAKFTIEVPGAGPQLKMTATLTATAGPKIDTGRLRTSITGLKSGEVKDRIKAYPGVQDTTVKYAPFWVVKAPKAEKITIHFEKSSAASIKGTDGQ